MHFSKCLTKANALKTFGWVQLARVCFQGQTLLRNRRNAGLSTNYFCYWRTIEWNVLLGFFSSHKLFSFLLVFNREVKTCCSKHMFGCCTENMKTAGMKSASLFFSLVSLFPKSSCTNYLWAVHVPTCTWREWQLHHVIWSVHFSPGGADRRISALLVNSYVHTKLRKGKQNTTGGGLGNI